MTGADERAGVCKGPHCHAPMLWAVTAGGARMPLNPGPVVDGTGNVALELRPDQPLDLATVLGPLEVAAHAGEALYVPHFATCPDRGNFTKGRR